MILLLNIIFSRVKNEENEGMVNYYFKQNSAGLLEKVMIKWKMNVILIVDEKYRICHALTIKSCAKQAIQTLTMCDCDGRK